MARYVCQVCEYVCDEEKEGVKWEDLPDSWECPVCGSAKSLFDPAPEKSGKKGPAETPSPGEGAGEAAPVYPYPDELDNLESPSPSR